MRLQFSSTAFALFMCFSLCVRGRAQAPARVLPEPPVTPMPAVSYYSGPGVVYFLSPRHFFNRTTAVPSAIYPPGYSHNVGAVGTFVGLGLFQPRGVRTYYRPGFVGAP